MHTIQNPARPLARLAALLALVTLGVVIAPLAAHAAGDDVTWTVRTAANSYGADRTSYRYTVAPGSALTDTLVVTNHGDAPLELGVYAADGYTTDAGQLDLLLPDATQRGVGAWVSTGHDRITVAAGRSLDVPFTVKVPAAGTPGDYAGGIVTSLTQPDQGAGINVDRRLGIRISLRVSGVLKPGLAIDDQKLSWKGGLNPFAGGDATLRYTLRNTGNAILSAEQAATVSGPFGLFHADAAKIPAPPQLLPGESRTVSVPVHGVAAVLWLNARATVTPIFVDASGSSTPLTKISAGARGWAIPWLLLVVLLVVAALVVATILLQRHRRAGQKAREDTRVQEAVERALAEASAPERVES
ncbi:MAG TPA: DUF916 domain-containing protein [Gryllotalpicola sp.]